MQEQALAKIDSDDLEVFVVWTPRYPGDNREKAKGSKKIVSDERAVHFWDRSGCLGRHYGNIFNLPSKRRFAWDVYMVFDEDAEWKEVPAEPTQWSHQMGGVLGRKHPRWLDGEKFLEWLEDVVGD